MARKFKIVVTREIDAYRFEQFEIEAPNIKDALTLLKEGMVEPFQSFPYVANVSRHLMIEEVQGIMPSDDEGLAEKVDEILGEGHYYEKEDDEDEEEITGIPNGDTMSDTDDDDYADGEENLKTN
jgi:hypothetical protein